LEWLKRHWPLNCGYCTDQFNNAQDCKNHVEGSHPEFYPGFITELYKHYLKNPKTTKKMKK
jgi:hypothetical protein